MRSTTGMPASQKQYSHPRLTRYGGLTELTANGSIVGMENGSMTATEKG